MGSIAAVIGGLLVIGIALRDVFQSVIVPRAENTSLRTSRFVARVLWRIWPLLANAIYRNDERKREDLLGAFAPFTLIAILASWIVLMLLGWGLFFYGIRDELRPAGLTFDDTVYYAGSSLLTIGYGDIVPHMAAARIMSLFCAASGLGVVAIVISFLFAVFGSFQRREVFVVTVGARAGVPPSGVGLLSVHGHKEIRGDLSAVFRDGQTWTAEVMESHLAYPILIFFRSSHDYESWVGTLGALLDAASLVISTLNPARLENAHTQGQARIMYELGRHLTSDFAAYFRLGERDGSVGVERTEFDDACSRLADAGYELCDLDSAWAKFSELRSVYSSQLNGMARWLEIPPVQWVGDRSMLAAHKAHMG